MPTVRINTVKSLGRQSYHKLLNSVTNKHINNNNNNNI